MGRIGKSFFVVALLFLPVFPAFPAFPALPAFPAVLHAQHAAFRVKGRVTNERGVPIPLAAVRLEAFYGYFAGTFAGQRVFTTTTDAKGTWSIGAMQPGVWMFEIFAPGYVPELVILPIRILTTVSMGTSGMALTWDLVLKPLRLPDDERGRFLNDLTNLARDGGKSEAVRSSLERLPEDPDADFLAAAGRIAVVAGDMELAPVLFKKALERDPSSYRAAMGIASMFLFQRDFDSASRAFDATRNRTHDKDEQKFLSAAIGDLATIKIR
jgi:tetratricopeptide (TPR) repeat protein